jgi:hypothetical protein
MQTVIIQYNGGKSTIEFKQFNQTINLSRNLKIHGQACIVKNTTWQDMTQTIKPGNYNYYLMSNNKFINCIEHPPLSEDTTDKLIIQIVNVSKNLKQYKHLKPLQPDNNNILKSSNKIKSYISVEI